MWEKTRATHTIFCVIGFEMENEGISLWVFASKKAHNTKKNGGIKGAGVQCSH